MVLISYDISDNKKRARFAKYIKKYGRMLQYSLYEIDNSERILNNIITDINNIFAKSFEQTDSVYIFKLNNNCLVHRFGYARNEEAEIVVVK